MRTILFLIVISFSHLALAEELNTDSGNDSAGDSHITQPADETHPVYSADSHWVDSFLIGIAGLFVAAIVIGPIVRSEAPDAVPQAMSHEEDPAADRHN